MNNTNSNISYQKRPPVRRKSKRATKYQRTSYAQHIGAQISTTPELKNWDLGITSLSAPVTGVWSGLAAMNLIPGGSTPNSRVGRKINMTSLEFRMSCDTTAGGAIAEVFRILIVYDKAPNGATTSVLSILSSNDINGFTNLGNTDRYQILRDWYPQEERGTPSKGNSNSAVAKADKLHLKLNHQAIFTGNGGAIADISTGVIWLMMCTTPDANINIPMFYNCRIRYTDV